MIYCSAPGKIFLSGEYAVLLGSPAVVSAVDRRAVALISDTPDVNSSLVMTLHEHAARFLETEGWTIPRHLGVALSSSGFRIGKNKLGLGSSAAVAAGAVGALFELAGQSISERRADILRVAREGHRAAQGGKGSGADVAAAVCGGTIAFSMDGAPVPVDISGLHINVVWSGRSVSTTEMIGKISAYRTADPEGHQLRMSSLQAVAEALADAFVRKDGSRIVEGAREYAAEMDALGIAAKVPILTKPHKRLINLAKDLGGAAKPSGAGGGDIAVAFFTDAEASDAFRVRCIRHELPVLDLQVDAPGLRREPDT